MKKRGTGALTLISLNSKSSKSKRAQTTIFIIIAIVIIAIAIGTFYIINQNKKVESEKYFSQSNIKPTMDLIISQIVDCSEETSKKALNTIGIQGGYYNKPNKFYQAKSAFVPYYYYEGEYLIPSKITIQNELESYVNDNIESCLNNIKQEGFTILHKTPLTIVTIKEKEVLFEISQSTKITREEYTTNLDFSNDPIIIPSEINNIYELANYITDSHKQDPEMYCISCVGEIAQEKDLYVDILNFKENEMLIIISENHTSSEPFSFEFLNKYSGNEISPLSISGGTAPSSPKPSQGPQ
ncbi:MAG: hypothetical protein ABIH37_02405 [archaeon]